MLGPVSAVIPTHNRPQALQRAIKSVLAQTHPVHEIVVVDDGSDPCAETGEFDSSPITVRMERIDPAAGVAAARNRGAMQATGDFVAFLDDDDVWVPWKMEAVADCFAKHTDADVLLHGSSAHMPRRAHPRPTRLLEEPLKRMLYRNPPHVDGVVVRRSLHLDSPFDESFVGAEDVDYLIRLGKSGGRILETETVLAAYGEATPSAIGIKVRIDGRVQLLAKHPEITADHKAAAHFYVRLGHLQRRAGMRRAAVDSFLTAGRHRPLSPHVWKGLVRALFSSVAAER